MPKVVVHAIDNAMTNAAAAANTGWQRAASHSTSGNSNANGTTVANDTCVFFFKQKAAYDIAANAAAPSKISFGDGGSRTASAIPISSGATVTIPSASDANQCCQIVRLGAVEELKSLNPRVPTNPDIALAQTAAPTTPKISP